MRRRETNGVRSAAVAAAVAVMASAAPAAAVPIQYYFKISPREAKIDAGGKEADVFRVGPGDALTLVAKGPGVLRAYYYQDYMPGKPFPTGIRLLVSVQGKGGKAYDVSPKPLRGMKYTTRGVQETPTAPDPFNVVVPAEEVSVTIRLAASASFGGAISFPGAERIPPPEGEMELPALALGPEAGEPEMELPSLDMPSLTPPPGQKVAKAEPPPSIQPLDLPLEEEMPSLTPTTPMKTAKAEPAIMPLDLPLEEEMPSLTPTRPAPGKATAKTEPMGIEPLDLPPLTPDEEPGIADIAPLAPIKPTTPGKKEPTKVAAAPTPGARVRGIEATRVEQKPKPLAAAVPQLPPPPPPAPFVEPPLSPYRVTPKVAFMLPRAAGTSPQIAGTIEITYRFAQNIRLGAEAGYNLFQSSTTRLVTGRGVGQVLQANHAVPLFGIAAYELPGGGGIRPYAGLGVGVLATLAQVRAFSLQQRTELTLAPAVQVALGARFYFARGGVLLEVRHQEAVALGFSKQALGAEGLMSATMFAAGYAVEF